MKSILLGSTALVAAVSVTGAAQAAQGVQLGLGGYYQGAAAVLFSQDDGTGEPGAHTRSVVFRQDVEIHFKGETTLDNGLTVGARIEMEGQQSDDQIDEVWAYFKGGWGQVRFGDDDEAYEQLGYLIPSASSLFGVDSPHFEFSNSKVGSVTGLQTNATTQKLTGDATKVIYFSPTFAGFSFAVSYAPDRRGEDTYSYGSGPGGTTNSNNTSQVQDAFAAALNFTHDFGEGTKLVAGVGAGEGQWETTLGGQNDTTWTVRGHLIVNFAGFTLGGAGTYRSNYRNVAGVDDVNLWVAGAGGTYHWDAFTVGLAYSHGSYEISDNDDVDTLDIVELTGRYDLSPGISLDAMVGFHDYENDAASINDDQTWEGAVGFNIGF
jgi:hypothetical protein